MEPWPGWDEPPVILNATARPRFRPRMNSEHPMYYDSYGRLLVPAGPAVGINSLGGQHHHRSSSMTGRPAQIVINNELRDEHHEGRGERERDRRPRSSHFHDFEVVARDRTRSRSRVRIRERDVVRDRTPSPYYEYEQSFETREKLKKLEEYEKKQEEAAHKKRLEEEMFIKAAKEAAEAAAHKKEEEELKKKAIAEWQAKEAEEKEKAKKKQEEEDKAFGEKMRKTMWANGFSDEQIERMIKKAEKKEKGGGDWGESSGSGHKHQPQPTVVTSGVLALNRPTFIKVHRKHIDPDTLDFYQLPWEWDPSDGSFILIKQWIPEHQQDILFEHTRKLREVKQITYTTQEIKKERDQLLLVRKKEPRKRSTSAIRFFAT